MFYVKLKEEINKGQKTEERALAGILKGYSYALSNFSYTAETLADLFIIVKTLVQPLNEGRYIVAKAALRIFSQNAGIFKDNISEHAYGVFKVLFDLSRRGPPSMRYLAHEACEQVLSILTDSLHN